MVKAEKLIRRYGLGSIAKLARDPFDPTISESELHEVEGRVGWYRSSILRTMQTSGLSIEDVRTTLNKSKGRNTQEILNAIKNL